MSGLAFSNGPARTATEVNNLRIRAAVDAMAILMGPRFVYPSQLLDLRGPAPKPAPEFRAGDRVWLYPGAPYGMEATVNGVARADYVPVVDIEGDQRSVAPAFVVLFDENHNQKRAFSRGKVIEARIRPTRYNKNYTGRWHRVDEPAWDGAYEYRVQPPKAERDYTVAPYETFVAQIVDKFAAEKAAYAEGKTIQCRSTKWRDGVWIDCTPVWAGHCEYRVKPEPGVVRSVSQVALPLMNHRTLLLTLDVESTDGKVTNVTVKEFS